MINPEKKKCGFLSVKPFTVTMNLIVGVTYLIFLSHPDFSIFLDKEGKAIFQKITIILKVHTVSA